LIGRLVGRERGLLLSALGSLGIRLAGMAASFIIGVQLARGLNPDGFGAYGIVIAVALVLSVISQFGLQTIATREISICMAQERWGSLRGYVGSLARVVLGVSLVLAAVWAGVAAGLPSLLGPPGISLLGAGLVPLYALTVLVSAQLRALGHLVGGQTMEILIRPLLMSLLLLFVAIVAIPLTATTAIALQAAASLATLLVGILWLLSAMPAPARSASAVVPRGWGRSAAALAAVDILRQLDATYGILLIGMLSSQAEAGYFRVALSTIVIVATPLSVLNVVLAPTLARLHSEKDLERLQWILGVAAIAMFGSALAALVIIALAGKPLLVAIFGSSYAPAWKPLALLTAAQAVNGFFGVGWVFLSMSGGERMLTRSFAVSVAVSLVVAVPLIAWWGAAGAAGAALVGAFVQNLLAWRGVRTHSSLESSAAGLLWRARFSEDASA